MMSLTFNELPEAVENVYRKLESVEQLLLSLLQHSKTENVPTAGYLTIEEAASFLKLTKSTIYGLVSRRSIPVSKRGKRLYFSQNELTEWIGAGRKKTYMEMQNMANNYRKI